MATKGKTAKFYASSPKSLAKKQAYNRQYAATPEAIAKRAELVKLNREMFKKGTGKKGDSKDISHQKGGGTKLESPSKNRGGQNMASDRRARPIKKKSK